MLGMCVGVLVLPCGGGCRYVKPPIFTLCVGNAVGRPLCCWQQGQRGTDLRFPPPLSC